MRLTTNYMKICAKCKETKDLTTFHKDKTKSDGLHNYCKICRKQLRNIHYSKNKKKVLKQTLEWRFNNRERVNELARNLRKLNPDKQNDANKKWKLNNKEKVKAYYKLRKELNPLIKVIESVRSRLRESMKVNKWFKTTHFAEYIGCTKEQFKSHLESLFQPGMTWDNYGYGKNKWTLDHIKPISLAKNEQEIYILSHYKNLQPMWLIENIKKGNKVI